MKIKPALFAGDIGGEGRERSRGDLSLSTVEVEWVWLVIKEGSQEEEEGKEELEGS